MNAVIFKPYSVLRLPSSFSAFRNQTKLKAKHSAFIKDITEDSISANLREGTKIRSIPTRNSATEEEDDEYLSSATSDSLRQKQMIALLSRIQSSISAAEEKEPKDSNQSHSVGPSSAEAILNVLRQAEKESKEIWRKKQRTRRDNSQKEHEIASDTSPAEFKLQRQPSSFVKKSPLPTLTPLRGNSEVLMVSAAAVDDDEVKPGGMEKMKLSELKQLAKERGIKGYSRMKKSDLVQLLKS